jgi:hypothetical protein
MKKVLVLLIVVNGATLLHAQLDPSSVMAKAPAIPGNLCAVDTASMSMFTNGLVEFNRILDQEKLLRKHREADLKERLEKDIKNKMAKQYGLSQADVQKSENMSKMTKEQRDKMRKEMAEKMMQQSGGSMTSVEDVTGIKDVKTKKGQTAYAKNLVKPMEAEKAANPEKAAADAAKAKKLATLADEQQSLLKSLGAMEAKYERQLWDLDHEPTKSSMEKKMKWYDSCLGAYNTSGGKPPNPYSQPLIDLKKEYCSEFTPRFVEIINYYIAAVSEKLTQYARLEQLDDEIFKLQNGTNESPVVPGLLRLDKITQCTLPLNSINKYNLLVYSDLYPPEQ